MPLQKITFATRDEYKRVNTAQSIERLLSNDTLNISRLLINGEWGEGKTEFCHKLLNHLGHDDYHLVYVDAFASDSVDNPLLTLTAEVAKLIPDGETRKRFIEKVKPALKIGAKTAGKAVINWIARQDSDSIAEDFEKELQKGAEQLSDLAIDAVIKEQIDAEKNIASLKNAITLLTEGANSKPIIICIDEFDRCRPPYAISMLETVKHVFDTKGVKFIFSANKVILEQSIKHHYGVEDASRYLDKFMDFSIELPRSEFGLPGRQFEFKRVSIQHLTSILRDQYNLTNASTLFSYNHKGPGLMLEVLERVPTFTLRDAEKLARNIAVYSEISQIEWNHDYFSYVPMLGIFAYTFYRKELENLEKSEYTQEQIFKHFIDYPDKESWNHDRSNRSLIFSILMSGITPISSQRFTLSEEEIVNHISNFRGQYWLTDVYDLKEAAKKFPESFRVMLNLA
ncbi:P-loop NTPase fold protein [Vibrio fluvialis]|uniref:KAP family P-loop NTPase fold protein n=1 Tax=Vibrio fluvialis TaxID=676 RepID=UPI001EEADDA2|nr:P-loop NTPase fold protein [Vibrio fluvialis]EKO4003674.1 hypothetical protein [Vibrio fluvialis]MCG6410345.1 KAP family NTPase [Vibrio fluvialis]WDY53612.1 P-loop NTPase fold protein [Vibrio fluvialis]